MIKLLTVLLFFISHISFSADKPNIIFIYADDIGYGDFGCYGGEVQTVNIDDIAEKGVQFLNGYCTSSTCTPSRYSLLTGEHAFRNKGAKILEGNAPLIIDPKRPTIAQFLKDNGYSTMLSGKWHLGLGTAIESLNWNGVISPGPKELGFTDSFHMAATADRVPSVYIRDGKVVDLDPNDPIEVSYVKKVGNEPTGLSHPHLLSVQADEQHAKTIINGISRIGWMSGGHQARFRDEDMADTYLNEAISFIHKSKNKPFFLYFAPNENHVPRIVHKRFQGSTSLGPRGDAIAVFDWCVGRLVEELKIANVFDNTLIIITSDNGPVLFDGYWDGAIEKKGTHKAAGPLKGGKYSLWEGGTRVPFIAYWPKKSKPLVSNAIVSQLDLYATIADIIDIPIPENAGQDGVSVLDALIGESEVGRSYVVQEAPYGLAIRFENFKFIPPGIIRERVGIGRWKQTNVPKPGFLFDLSNDINEDTNLSSIYPNRVREINELLINIRSRKN